MKDNRDPNHEELKSNYEKKSRFLEEFKEEDNLPEIPLQNYRSNIEFDRLGLKKENSEDLIKKAHKEI